MASPLPSPPDAVSVTYTPIRRDADAPQVPHADFLPKPPVPPKLTAAQLEGMARLFSTTPMVLSERLRKDPGLYSIGIEATEQGRQREHKGKVMTTLGWTIVGLGLTVATGMYFQSGFDAMAPWGDCDNRCQDARANSGSRAFAVGLASLVAGMAIALPGMLMLRHPSEKEKQAVLRYRREEASW